MKNKLATVAMVAGLIVGGISHGRAGDVTYSTNVFNGVLATAQNIDLDLNLAGVQKASVQVIYSSANPSVISFNDGVASTGSITTVTANLSALTTAYATAKITVISTTGITGSTLYFNGYPLTEGNQWTNTHLTTSTAISISNALNANYGSLIISSAPPGSSVVYSSAVTAGSVANAFTLLSSTPAALSSSATYSGGQDNASVTIAGRTLTNNLNWFSTASSITTTTSLKAAIAADPFLSTIINVATSPSNVINATSTYAGFFANYSLVSSTPSALTMSNPSMTGGVDSTITSSITLPSELYLTNHYGGGTTLFSGSQKTRGSTIYQPAISYSTATAVRVAATAGSLPSPLVASTTYYITNLNPSLSVFQLATSAANAIGGTAIDIQALTAAGGDTYTITMIPASGTFSFKLQSSDDGVNFHDVYVSTDALVHPFAASASLASPYTASDQEWDLGSIVYRWLRFAYTNATWGGVNMQYIINGRKE